MNTNPEADLYYRNIDDPEQLERLEGYLNLRMKGVFIGSAWEHHRKIDQRDDATYNNLWIPKKYTTSSGNLHVIIDQLVRVSNDSGEVVNPPSREMECDGSLDMRLFERFVRVGELSLVYVPETMPANLDSFTRSRVQAEISSGLNTATPFQLT